MFLNNIKRSIEKNFEGIFVFIFDMIELCCLRVCFFLLLVLLGYSNIFFFVDYLEILDLYVILFFFDKNGGGFCVSV